MRVARIFNTYGPRMDPDDGRVVSNLIVQALTGSDLSIYGDGRQTRSFCYVSDMVEGLTRLMTAPAGAGPVNLGNPDERTILEIAELVIGAVGVPATLRFHPLPIDDPTHRCPDISLARRHLAWEPEVSLADGIRRTVTYFADQVRSCPPFAAGLAEAAE